jgi:hypothetical protein
LLGRESYPQLVVVSQQVLAQLDHLGARLRGQGQQPAVEVVLPGPQPRLVVLLVGAPRRRGKTSFAYFTVTMYPLFFLSQNKKL